MTKLTMEEKQQLIRMALAAREKAYAPYSDFMVGAALRAADGRIFTGCNVENAAFTPTSCAERTALFKAVAEGVTTFTDIAVVGSRRGGNSMTKLTMEEKQQLIRMALAAREKAYAPYSDFMVGAALRAADGRIFTGCNVENAAFTPTSCAERTALFKAVAEGVTTFTDIAVVGSRRGEVNRQITSPCGVCRQALFEFGGPELNVIMAKTPEDFIERSMDELLPFGFGPSNVAGNSAVEGK